MNKENKDFVKFQTAKVLRKHGFNENCFACYDIYNPKCTEQNGDVLLNYGYIRFNETDDMYAAPTLIMAMRWLRRTHNIWLNVYLCQEKAVWRYNINKYHKHEKRFDTTESKNVFDTWEEAADYGIKECVKKFL